MKTCEGSILKNCVAAMLGENQKVYCYWADNEYDEDIPKATWDLFKGLDFTLYDWNSVQPVATGLEGILNSDVAKMFKGGNW